MVSSCPMQHETAGGNGGHYGLEGTQQSFWQPGQQWRAQLTTNQRSKRQAEVPMHQLVAYSDQSLAFFTQMWLQGESARELIA